MTKKQHEPLSPHQFHPTDYRDFKPTEQVLTRVNMANMRAESYTAHDLTAIPTDLAPVLQRLKDAGFRRVSRHSRNGAFSFLYEANNHQMLRIVSADWEKPRDWRNPTVLQPLTTYEIPSTSEDHAGYRVEVLPKVHSMQELIRNPAIAKRYGIDDPKAESQRFMRRLLVDNLHNHRLFFDLIASNIGVIQDRQGHNVPIIIDADACSHEKHKEFEADQFDWFCVRVGEGALKPDLFPEVQQYLKPGIRNVMKSNLKRGETQTQMSDEDGQRYLDYLAAQTYDNAISYKKAQTAHMERLGFRPREANRVLDAQQLAKELETASGSYRRALEQGIAPGEYGDAIKEIAATHYAKDENGVPLHKPEKFCTLIDRQLVATHNIREGKG